MLLEFASARRILPPQNASNIAATVLDSTYMSSHQLPPHQEYDTFPPVPTEMGSYHHNAAEQTRNSVNSWEIDQRYQAVHSQRHPLSG